ncbi:MFS transporter [Curvibacter sp. RS43]|uniref:MFS transporter n=1 Tax=Curvibacter microcysteis TaxID=3026419 RepID=UPI002361196F|nr:MFS transporter [Curvibacter sp. RS43]MDD0812864.1 MFS transporter [Curvibacter sp. RS43]
MSSLEQTVPSAPPRPSAAALGTSIVILATAAFILVTTEFLIVGLLPAMARDLFISISQAGLLVTLFAFTVMSFGPLLTAWVAHIERKRLFVIILLVFAGSNALAAVAPNLWVLGFARFIPALALPVFWGTASETAAQLAGPERAGQAVSAVYLGISAAMLLGIPLGTLAAEAIGWRGAFWLLAAMSLLIAVTLQVGMPTVRSQKRLPISEQLRILHDPVFVANVALSVLVFTAMFTAYTYLADTLENAARVPKAQVGWWLMGFGAVGLFGNWLGGRWVDSRPLGVTALFSMLLAIGMAASMAFASNRFWLCIALALWGVANTALYPVCQIRVMKAASHAKALAGTLNVSAANAGIGLGAIVGGLAIPVWGPNGVGYVAAVIAIFAAASVPLIRLLSAKLQD